MAKEIKDKIQKLKAEIADMYIQNDKLAATKSANLQQLGIKLNELEKLKQE